MRFNAPSSTTVNDSEFIPEQNVIPFAPELIDFIINNLKTTTYRFGRKYDYLHVGNTVAIQNSSTKDIIGHAVITRKSYTTFKDLPLSSGSHEAYEDKEQQRKVHSGYYAYLGRPITDDDEYVVFDFELTSSK